MDWNQFRTRLETLREGTDMVLAPGLAQDLFGELRSAWSQLDRSVRELQQKKEDEASDATEVYDAARELTESYEQLSLLVELVSTFTRGRVIEARRLFENPQLN